MHHKLLVVLAVTGLLIACQKQTESPQEVIPSASIDGPSDQQLEVARQQVVQWHNEMLDKEAALIALYEDKKSDDLEKLADSISSQNGAPGDTSMWKSDAFRTYLKCDTAWGKLGLYGGVLKMHTKTPTSSMRSIVDSQKREYEKSKAICEQRLSLTPREAYKLYQNS